MEKLRIPEFVGHKVQVLQISRKENDVVGWSVWGWRAPTKNPNRCPRLVERLRSMKRPPHFRVTQTYPGIEIFSTGAYEYEFEDS